MTSVAQILTAFDAERSAARVADIELGLAAGDRVDQSYWAERARSRVQALDEDEAGFGLADHEVAERVRLKELLAAHDARRQGGGAR